MLMCAIGIKGNFDKFTHLQQKKTIGNCDLYDKPLSSVPSWYIVNVLYFIV